MNTYEEKKQARIDRYRMRAANAQQRSTELYEESHEMAEHIPFGQPILVGHHSEQRDRNYRQKIWNKMGKSVEEQKKADYWAHRAEAVENSTAVSSDDPEAIEKLQAKIQYAEALQQAMKAQNKIIHTKKFSEEEKREQLKSRGCSEVRIHELLTPDFMGRIGNPPYLLSNNTANIRRMRERLERLERQANAVSTEIEVSGVRIVENVGENRCQLFFPDKPRDEVRAFLKSNGFRWARSIGAWQRYRSTQATFLANQLIEKFYQKEV